MNGKIHQDPRTTATKWFPKKINISCSGRLGVLLEALKTSEDKKFFAEILKKWGTWPFYNFR
jgi:hypothetical protein